MGTRCFESLEGRSLMAAAPPATTASGPADAGWAFSMSKSGVVAINGSDADDTFRVRVDDKGQIHISVESVSGRITERANGLVQIRFVGGGGVAYAVAQQNPVAIARLGGVVLDGRSVSQIIVVGGNGNDRVVTDTVTNAMTTTRGVESRAVVYGKHMEKVIDNAMSAGVVGTYHGSNQRWNERSTTQIAGVAGRDSDAVFLGDSMIERFASTGAESWDRHFGGVAPINLGLSGDTTSQMLVRIQNQGLLDGLTPKVVVLEIGTNNVTQTDDPDDVADGVRAVINAIQERLPDTRILLCSVLPRPTSFDNRVVNKVNARLSAFDDGDRIRFLDTTATFTGDQAKAAYFRKANLHLNENGYEAWALQISPLLVEMLKAAD